MAALAQNEMKAKGAMPLRVRLTDGLGGEPRAGRSLADMGDGYDGMAR